MKSFNEARELANKINKYWDALGFEAGAKPVQKIYYVEGKRISVWEIQSNLKNGKPV